MPDTKKNIVPTASAEHTKAVKEIQIIEYDLAPKPQVKKERKKAADMNLDDLFLLNLPMVDDVKNEETFKAEKKLRQSETERTEEATETGEKPVVPSNTYSAEYLQALCDQMADQVQRVETELEIDIRSQEILNRCWKIRECPDTACRAYQAHNPRCWYLAGEQCGCRMHLGIVSCFQCQVFQMATLNPYIQLREMIYYILGMVRNRNQQIKHFENQIQELKQRILKARTIPETEAISNFDDLISDQQLIGDFMNFKRRAQKLDDTTEQESQNQHRILTEQLGSAYLQLQILTSQLEKTNADLEQKVTERTEELRKSNKALREAIKKAQEADRLKSEFIANVSHELRTPLNSIIGFSKVLLSRIDGDINPTQEVDLSAIYNSGRHLLDIINSILDLSKIEAGKMELNISTFELVPMIEEIVTAGQTLVMGKRVRLESRILGSIPPIEADATKIRQVIFNLVSNAAKFTEEGWITIQASVVGEGVSISVIDTGIGIDKEALGSIFERFRQVDGSSTRRAGGTGLGLSIAKKFVEMHNGDLTVESKLGKGSVFTMHIPIKYKPQAAPATDEPAES